MLIDIGTEPGVTDGDMLGRRATDLRRAVRLADFIGRVGDRVFAVVLERIGSDADFEVLRQRLLEAAGPRARLGYALYPDQAQESASLQRLAEAVLKSGTGSAVA